MTEFDSTFEQLEYINQLIEDRYVYIYDLLTPAQLQVIDYILEGFDQYFAEFSMDMKILENKLDDDLYEEMDSLYESAMDKFCEFRYLDEYVCLRHYVESNVKDC